ncbi:MAG TPA: GAF domain-containing sensor histidine kinase [Gemmatimonadaceae bacterium]|nr:GAF domain-containing sensor histidine kinase [Gemmatimonadaceae bacterium]
MQLQPEVTSVTADARPSRSVRTDDSGGELEKLREELQRVRDRARNLLDVATALSEASSVEDVTGVFLTKGLAVVEAARGVLVSVEGGRVRLLGSRGISPELEAKLGTLTLETEIPVVHALRKGEMISIESADEFRRLYASAYEGFSELADMETYLAAPLTHAGEMIGAIALHFREANALGAADRAFTLLLAQATATALYRAKSYDAEREKRKNAELESRAREEALGVVAHDLRNPLSLIVTTTELLQEENLEPARRKEILDITMRAGKQMNRLIDDLLDTVHIESGKFVLSLEDVEVCAILRQAEETFRPIAERRKITFGGSSPGREVWVRADPLRVSQVIGNLIGNALKFTPENGSVTYGADLLGGDVEFSVTDTGPGISPEQQEHLFEMFWQARKDDRRGVGLGLTIAKGIVDAHGGRIWCQSTPGRGSTFSFTLPALQRVAGTAAT